MGEIGPKDLIENTRLRMVGIIIAEMVAAKTLPKNEVVGMIATLREAFEKPVAGSDSTQLKPAVPIEKSVNNDYLVCLEDGRQLKMLKRHLRTEFNMTPEQYRQKWGLPANYPMVAPAYAKPTTVQTKSSGSGKAKVPSGVKKPVSMSRRAKKTAKPTVTKV